MLNNKKYKRFYLNFLLFLGTAFFSVQTYSMLCPTNFNAIEIGYTIDQVIRLCGNPDERAEEKEIVSDSTSNSVGQSYGNYYQARNSYYSQGQGNYQQLNDVKERVIIWTRFIYHFPQPSALIFEDGILKDKILLH